jgi:hypothetical protein
VRRKTRFGVSAAGHIAREDARTQRMRIGRMSKKERFMNLMVTIVNMEWVD